MHGQRTMHVRHRGRGQIQYGGDQASKITRITKQWGESVRGAGEEGKDGK